MSCDPSQPLASHVQYIFGCSAASGSPRRKADLEILLFSYLAMVSQPDYSPVKVGDLDALPHDTHGHCIRIVSRNVFSNAGLVINR